MFFQESVSLKRTPTSSPKQEVHRDKHSSTQPLHSYCADVKLAVMAFLCKLGVAKKKKKKPSGKTGYEPKAVGRRNNEICLKENISQGIHNPENFFDNGIFRTNLAEI